MPKPCNAFGIWKLWLAPQRLQCFLSSPTTVPDGSVAQKVAPLANLLFHVEETVLQGLASSGSAVQQSSFLLAATEHEIENTLKRPLLGTRPRTLSTAWSVSVPLLLGKAQPLSKGIRGAGGRSSLESLPEAALELASGYRGLR